MLRTEIFAMRPRFELLDVASVLSTKHGDLSGCFSGLSGAQDRSSPPAPLRSPEIAMNLAKTCSCSRQHIGQTAHQSSASSWRRQHRSRHQLHITATRSSRWALRDHQPAETTATATADPVLAACQEVLTSTQQLASRALLPLTFSTAAALLCLPEAALALPGITTPLPLQILGFLLNNPVVTLVIAGVAIWAIPRLARAAVRFILIPAAFLGLAYLVVTNPQTSFTFAGTALSCEPPSQVQHVCVLCLPNFLMMHKCWTWSVHSHSAAHAHIYTRLSAR